MDIENVLVAIKDLKEDSSTPRNVRARMEEVEHALAGNEEINLKLTKAIHVIEELTEDVNLQQFTRAQLMNLVAILQFNM